MLVKLIQNYNFSPIWDCQFVIKQTLNGLPYSDDRHCKFKSESSASWYVVCVYEVMMCRLSDRSCAGCAGVSMLIVGCACDWFLNQLIEEFSEYNTVYVGVYFLISGLYGRRFDFAFDHLLSLLLPPLSPSPGEKWFYICSVYFLSIVLYGYSV